MQRPTYYPLLSSPIPRGCQGKPKPKCRRLRAYLTLPSQRGEIAAHLCRMLKRPSSKAAASEEARRTLRYVEPLSDARTPLADFFSILSVVTEG